ncbi:hypothetical protein AB1Y20_004050 [Prymnesium parvum]|uniref:Uncharacterized protein n=1 Tax=Prymnesium parvum TaxID=97485 RepID=A0AB34J8S6_PRYPA
MEHKCTATPVRVTARADGYKPIVREGGGSAGARPVVRAVAHPKAVEADPMRPADSSIERRTPPEAVPGLAAECTSAAAPETEHAVPEEATQGATKEPPWMPPWASAPGASSPTAPRTDPLAIVERAVAESCGARTSRPSSSPTSRTAASTLHRPASARGASGSKSARKLSEADEKEMLRRLYGKAWAHEAELERKRLEELNEAKIKKVSTKDLEQMVSGLWNSAKEQRRKQDQWRETELAHKCRPTPPTRMPD